MNIKQSLSSLGFSLLLLAACTNENEQIGPQVPGDNGPDDLGRREVLLELKNDLVMKPATTRADGEPIATEDENYIQSLDVYVFGSKEEQGVYTFQELHYYRDDATELPANAKVKSFPFNLANTTPGTTTAVLKFNKGLFVKLYVVANRTHLYQTDETGAMTEFTGFQSLMQDKPGQPENQVTPGAPTLDSFLKFHTQLIDPLHVTKPTADDILTYPLPMTGAHTTALDLTDFGASARAKVSFKLSRMVARFDIVNDAGKSRFTIEKISMGNGRSGAGFFPIEVLKQEKDDLITYIERPLSALTQQAPFVDVDNPLNNRTDVTKGAFYTWPSPMGDEGYLMLKGKYAANKTEVKDVSYRVPFQQIVNGVGSYIEVAYNHRYTIAITKADDYHLDFTLTVEDWDDKEDDMIYNPDNDFDKATILKLDETPGANVGAYALDNGHVELLAATGSKLTFNMGSNTPLTEQIIYKDGSVEWIKKETARATRATSMDSLYTYEVDEALLDDPSKILSATIRLTNPASGLRKEIRVFPAPGPVVTWTEGTAATDLYSKFNPATHTATIYNLANQTIKLHVAASTRSDRAEIPQLTTGSSAAVHAGGTWLTSDQSAVATAEGDYTLTLGTAQGSLPASTTVDFTSTATTVATRVNVVLKDPAMATLKNADFVVGSNNELDISGGTGGCPKVILNGVANNSFTLTVVSPEGVTLAVAPVSGWLTATANAGQALPNGLKTTIITGKITNPSGMGTTPKEDGKITIVNKVDPAQAFEVEVVTKLPVAPVVTMKDVSGNLSTFIGGTATLMNAIGQTITLVTDMATTGTTAEGSWLAVSGGSTKEHLITLSAAGTPGVTTGTITFTSATGSVQTVTVALANPAITDLAAADFTSTNGANTFGIAVGATPAKVTMAEATANSAFTLKVKSKGGVSVGAATSDWLAVTKTQEIEVTGGKEATFTVAVNNGTDLAAAITDGKIVLANAIKGGGDLTIDVVTTVAP